MGYVRDKIRAQRAARWDDALTKAFADLPAAKVAAARDTPALLDFIPQISPELESPHHLQPVVDAFAPISMGEVIELAFSVPPRHFKTTTLLHGIAWLFVQRPGFRVAYLTYSDDRAQQVSREMQRIVRRAGLGPADGPDRRWTFAEWETSTGCKFRAASLLAGVVGAGFDLIIVDDPYRKRQDVESPTIRRRTRESWAADVYTRQETHGTSFIVLHTRWHPDDLIGNITDPDYRDGRPFQYLNLPAIDDKGRPLAPDFYGLDRLNQIKATVGEYEWASQFQGTPRSKGGRVFDDAVMTETIPTQGQYTIGVDLAYSAKTLADYSVAVVLCKHGGAKQPLWTVVDLVRRQVRAPDFAMALKGLRAQYPGAPMRFYAAGVEKGGADWLLTSGVPLHVANATGDKHQRAQPVAAKWNDGKILIPRTAWADTLVDEVTSFTGINDDHDDIVDALAAAYDLSAEGTGTAEVSTKPNPTRRSVRKLRDVY